MSDNNNSKKNKAKLPVDAKESFLKSVEKKSTQKIKKEETVDLKKTQDESKKEKDIPVLFDSSEPEQQDQNEIEKTEKEEKTKPEKTQKEKKQSDKKTTDNKKNKEKKSKKKEAPTLIKIPFINIIPYIMCVQSLILVFLPFLKSEGFVTNFVVTLFWIAVLAAGGLMLYLKLAYRKNIESLYAGKSKGFIVYRFFSIVNFFRNKTARITDLAFLVMLIVLVVIIVLGSKNIFDNAYLTAIIMSLFMLSLNFHVYFNDSIYEYSKKFNKFTEEKEVIDNE